MTRLVYFAWVRERIGKGEEEIVLPPSVKTVARSHQSFEDLGRRV